MSTSATHIIARQSFRFRFEGAIEAADVQGEIARLCNEELPARLNTLFDSLAGPETVLRIPKLDVRLELDAQEPIPADLGKRLSLQIEEALRAAIQDNVSSSGRQSDARITAIAFYLERGYYPWWSTGLLRGDSGPALQLLNDAELTQLAARLRSPAAGNRGRRLRLQELVTAANFPERLLESWYGFTAGIAAGLPVFLRSMYVAWNSTGTEDLFRRRLSELLVELLPAQDFSAGRTLYEVWEGARRAGLIGKTGATPQLPFLQHVDKSKPFAAEIISSWNNWAGQANEAFHAVRSENAADRQLSPLTSNQESAGVPSAPGAPSDQRIRIQNAGMVLVAAYLPALFEACNVLSNDRIADPARAIALLRYVAYTDVACGEQDLILEKILCGMDLADSPGPLPALSQLEMDECTAMLQAVIANWTVLKQTSPEGLQQGFLRRDGLLQPKDSGWQLKVQRQGHDILLDFLPWSYSILKLPWMKGMLFVDWTT